jgi:hypothetical protein
MTKGRKAPRWTIAFLRALARTGDVRAAAEDAGIDHSTAYARRKTHAEFASLWRGALAAHERWVQGERVRELEALGPRPSTASGGPPPSAGIPRVLTDPQSLEARCARSEQELVGGGAQLKRAGHDRWSQRKEKLFFDELAATANVKRAAKAAGVSTQAVFARRLREAHFRAKWAAVLETGRASIEMHLVEAANRSFEPDELDVGDAQPKVTVAEAIRIVQAHGSKAQRDAIANPFADQAASMSADEVEELRERIFKKMQRLSERHRQEKIAEGWSLDEEHDHLIPPGWVRAAD